MAANAFIFDLNGTIIDDMHYHTEAWFTILNNDLGASLTWQEVKAQMYGKNEELLIRVFGDNHFTADEMKKWSLEKEKRYQQAFLPQLKLINGLAGFLQKVNEEHIPMAIGSAAIPFNIDFVLDNLHIRHYFKAIVSAADVRESKPHPQTFLDAARLLNIPPAGCIVFEDAPKGVEAAHNAGMKAVVLTTMHEQAEFENYPNIIGFVKDYTDPLCEQLFTLQ